MKLPTDNEQGWQEPADGDEPASELLGPALGQSFGYDVQVTLGKCIGRGHQRKMELLSRIFLRCRAEGTCLIWQGGHSGDGRGGGYGRISFEGRTSAVHKLVYQLVYGPIPSHKQVDHSCNNRLCCNPDHLKHMTHKRNQKLRDERASKTKED